MNYIYGVKDIVVGEFINTFVAPNDNSAIRVFATSVNSLKHPLRDIYQDIDLYRLGAIDLKTGGIYNIADSKEGFEFLNHGTDFYKKTPIELQSMVAELVKDEYEKMLAEADKQAHGV